MVSMYNKLRVKRERWDFICTKIWFPSNRTRSKIQEFQHLVDMLPDISSVYTNYHNHLSHGLSCNININVTNLFQIKLNSPICYTYFPVIKLLKWTSFNWILYRKFYLKCSWHRNDIKVIYIMMEWSICHSEVWHPEQQKISRQTD